MEMEIIMKKLLLIPAALVLSTGFAFAGGYSFGPVSQSAHISQSITGTSYWSKAENEAKIAQAQVVVGPHRGVSQTAGIHQTINNTTVGSKAENEAKIEQLQLVLPW